MINIPKKRSCSIVCSIFLAAAVYSIIPVYLARTWHLFGMPELAVFYCCLAVIAFAVLRRAYDKRYQAQHATQDVREKINVTRNDTEALAATGAALSAKIARYNNLKKIIEQISSSLDLDAIASHLIDLTHSLFSGKGRACLLYLVDPAAGKLSLFKTKKDNPHQIIKAKEGDIFDQWVAQHANPLLVENIREDFRFDLDKIVMPESRPVVSLASAPFIVDNKFLGILRLDSPYAHAYTLDDLRLLASIADLGAVALENGELFKKTQELAIHDGLTGLYTKGYFLERLKDEIKRASRSGSPLSLLMLDIDLFKNYNDTFGHIAGDIVLKKMSAAAVDCLKAFDPVISRFGGEEICIILSHADIQRAHELAEELRVRIASVPVNLRKKVTSVTVSIGVAALPAHGQEANDLIMRADKAMYAAKEQGRNRVVDAL